MTAPRYLLTIVFSFFLVWVNGQSPDSTSQTNSPLLEEGQLEIEAARVMQVGKTYIIDLKIPSNKDISSFPITVNGAPVSPSWKDGIGSFGFVPDSVVNKLNIQVGSFTTETDVNIVNFPPWMSILPPLIAIVLALFIREVIVSLFVGIFVGAAAIAVYAQGSIGGIVSGFLTVIDTYLVNALLDSGHISIIVFSLLIGGMVAIISRNGGMQGVVNRISRIANTAKNGQFATWLLGLVIFFDDYANTLVVGNTMRSITDKLRISREKLSYLVDSTAAPVAALAFITTWIGAELGYIEGGIAGLESFPEGQSAYSIFVGSLAYAFYPVMTLLFILMIIFTGKDFGPMLIAEQRARDTGKVSRTQSGDLEDEALKHFQPLKGITPKAYNAVIPVLTLVGAVIAGLLFTGYDEAIWSSTEKGVFTKLSETIGNSDSYAALLWASLSAVTVALLMTMGQRMMPLMRAVDTMIYGFKAMFSACVILALAWSLQGVAEDMHTAGYLTDLLGDQLAPGWIPAITFIMAAVVSFSTGSSWGTMAILYPLMIPLVWEVSVASGLNFEDAYPLLCNTVACVLAGSVLGDHCSPISDTTILSSLACSCDHIDHVRTQLPYALAVGSVALLVGTIPTGFGFPSWISFPVGLGLLYLIIRWRGQTVEDEHA